MTAPGAGSAGETGCIGRRLVADLHIHSRFSRATSPRMELDGLARAARWKGVDLLGTGDATHPEWRAVLRRRLRPAGDGVYGLGGTLFLVTGELSVTWRVEGKCRRVHLVVLFPSIRAADQASRALGLMGALKADGRPALRASAVDVVGAIWSAAPAAVVIPSPVWTPWYSVFGARSGFDSLEACFGAYTEQIRALETGLSSDPAMCRRVSALDRLTLVSFSDAHSPERVGREATILALNEVSFAGVAGALSGSGGPVRTIELFPELGKYYFDGHRGCGVALSPDEARQRGGRCPACGKAVTPGVLHRVEDLADRREPRGVPPHVNALPLDEIVGQALGLSPGSRGVRAEVERLVGEFGSELSVTLDRPLVEVRDRAPESVARAVAAARAGQVALTAGYDGVYGVARLDI